MGEAGVTFALSFAAFAKKYFILSLHLGAAHLPLKLLGGGGEAFG
jgi:hypothetical protein